MEDLVKRAQIVLEKMDLESKKNRIKEIEILSGNSNFWKDNQKATAKMKEMANLQKEVGDADLIKQMIDEKRFEEIKKPLKELEVYLYLSGQYDKSNAILSIHAGQGGVDAMDWAEMLFRMYTRFFDRRGWKFDVLSETKGEEAGLKSVSMSVDGEFAYGYLKNEQGTHRLVRLSPFNSDKLRHTSFALVEVLPQIEDHPDVEINDDDLEWDFYRASAHGGQNVQKVSSAVRLRHKPTGIVVTCQTQRYQAQNREHALKLLKSKLWVKKQEEREREEKELRGEYKPASWGNQIRNYVLHPYKQVKDTRTKIEVGNTDDVLDGNLDIFIEAQLKELN